MYEIDWIETSRILFTSFFVALFTQVLAYFVQKLLIDKRFQKMMEQERRNFSYIERQLEEFYSPMIGCLIKVRAESDLRFKVSEISNEIWMEFVNRQPKPFFDSYKYHEPYQKSIEYDNDQFRDEIMPLYDKMLGLFTEKYWLANSSTREWYSIFSEYVLLWHRWLDGAIPADVIEKMGNTEEHLKPFYLDLGNQLDKLQKMLTG